MVFVLSRADSSTSGHEIEARPQGFLVLIPAQFSTLAGGGPDVGPLPWAASGGRRGEVQRQVDQEPCAEARGTLGPPRLVGLGVHRATYVKVRPRHGADKLRQEQRGRDRTGVLATHVLQVGDGGVDLLAVALI